MRTIVELVWIEAQVEYWIRFGRVVEETIHSRNRRTVVFDSGAVFAFVRWTAGEYGTVESRIDILCGADCSEAHTTIPHVSPGGDILLHLSGWLKVEAALAAIDRVEALGIAPEDACPDHWRHVHNRLTAGLTPRPYTAQRHVAWLKRREIGA